MTQHMESECDALRERLASTETEVNDLKVVESVLREQLERAKRFEQGIISNAPQCGACAEGLFTGMILHQHDVDCPISQRDSARANALEGMVMS